MKVFLVTAAFTTSTTHVRSFSPRTLSAVGFSSSFSRTSSRRCTSNQSRPVHEMLTRAPAVTSSRQSRRRPRDGVGSMVAERIGGASRMSCASGASPTWPTAQSSSPPTRKNATRGTIYSARTRAGFLTCSWASSATAVAAAKVPESSMSPGFMRPTFCGQLNC